MLDQNWQYVKILFDKAEELGCEDNIIISGSFPAYLYLLRRGKIDKIPSGVDIDVYIIADNILTARVIYNSLVNSIGTSNPIHVEFPDDNNGLFRTWGTHPYEIISQFDLSIVRMYIDKSLNIKYIQGENPLEDVDDMIIRVVHHTNPLQEMCRLFKYVSRGWKVDIIPTVMNVFLSWENLSPTMKRLAYDQLIEKYERRNNGEDYDAQTNASD